MPGCACCGSPRGPAPCWAGGQATDSLQASFGTFLFEIPPWRDAQERRDTVGAREHVGGILEHAGLPGELVDALDDESLDSEIRSETAEAFALTGSDVGTPISLRPARRSRTVRPSDQPRPEPRKRGTAVGSRRGTGAIRRLCRVEARPARTASVASLRRRAGRGGDRRRVARRQPSSESIAGVKPPDEIECGRCRGGLRTMLGARWFGLSAVRHRTLGTQMGGRAK